MSIDMETLNSKNASRKADREFIANTLITLATARGATIERRGEERNPGFCGAGIHISFALNGVGAMIDINDLHGGDWALIHWYNDYGRGPLATKYYSSRFNCAVGSTSSGRAHHKATSHPRDWYSLAMHLDAGLLLAARGEAFQADAA